MDNRINFYIGIKQVVAVKNPNVTIGCLGECWCVDEDLLKACKNLPFLTLKEKRLACSFIEVIQCMEMAYPEVSVVKLGEDEFILEQKEVIACPRWKEWLRFVIIWIILCIGAAFAIATFNEDVSVAELLEQVHTALTHQKRMGITLLEIGYAVGVGAGILIFYNHFSRKKTMSDPTPLEMEMRTYEKDLYHTMLENASRKKS